METESRYQELMLVTWVMLRHSPSRLSVAKKYSANAFKTEITGDIGIALVFDLKELIPCDETSSGCSTSQPLYC